MQVGQQAVQRHEEQAAQQETAAHRQQHVLTPALRHVHGGDQQRPHRRGDHHARRKAQKHLLHGVGHILFKEEYHARSQHRGKAGKAGAQGGVKQFTL